MKRIGTPSKAGRWATLYTDGWTVYDRRRGIVAQGVSRATAERMIGERGLTRS